MYSRKFLLRILHASTRDAETQEVAQNLLSVMAREEALSFAEEEFLGVVLGASVDAVGNSTNMHDIKPLRRDLFRHLYPLYVRNRDGLLTLADAYGDIPPARRKQDTDFLEAEYQAWRTRMLGHQHGSAMLQHVAAELKKHLADIEAFAKRTKQGSRLHEAAVKEIVLHSKYVLHFVEAYYQEVGATEQTITFAGGKIVVDSYAYIHILFRHYSQGVKSYQSGKSYHFDVAFDHTNLSNYLVDIIASYFRNLPASGIQDDRLFVRVRGTLYALWFRKMTRSVKGNSKENYYRLQTFYPITEQKDLLYASTLREIIADDGIGLLHKR